MIASSPAPHQRGIATLGRRYGFKLVATIAAAVAGVGADMAASRGLGPADYGKFYFLQQFFFLIFTFLSSSTSLAFVTRAARRPYAKGFTFLYVISLALMPFLLEAFALAAVLLGYSNDLWPGITPFFIYLGALAGYLTFLGREGTSMGDAYGLTVPLEKIRIAQRVLAVLAIGALYIIGLVNLKVFLIYTCVVNGALAGALFFYLWQHGHLRILRRLLRGRFLGTAVYYFYNYSSPLLMLSFVTTASALFDRWLLQRVSGNIDQGYFSLAYQISQMMLLLITAFVPLLMREMSILHGAKDRAGLRSVFERVIKNLYFIAALWACFAAVFCDKVAVLVGGRQFATSALPVALVVLSTMYRTYGQITSTLLYATGETRIYRNISIGVAIFGIALTYILVGPRQFFGFDMGAFGVAWKMLVTELIGGNALAYFCCRHLGNSYYSLFKQQVACTGALLLAAAAARFLVTMLVPASQNFGMDIVFISVGGFCYLIFGLLLAWSFPALAGLSREKLIEIWARLGLRQDPANFH